MYTVYKHTSPDGKVYIGQTSQIPKKRWKSGVGYINNEQFYRSILKYGWENFKHEILYTNLTKDESIRKEKELICFYKSNDPKYGFNISDGFGRTGDGKKVLCLETGVIYNTAADAEADTKVNRMHIGACCRDERISAGGYHWRFSNENCGIKEVRSRKRNTYKHGKVLCVETGVVYENCIEASEKTGITRSNIGRVCNNKRKTAGKFNWKYIE